MFKRALYPLTDWNWLKIPAAAAAMGGIALATTLAAAGSIAYHREHPEAAISAGLIVYFALALMYLVVALGFYGYLIRVARQPMKEQPLKLPNWSNPGSLIRDGFLVLIAMALVQIVVSIIVEVCIIAAFAAFGLLGAGLDHIDFTFTGVAVAFLGGGAVFVAGIIFLITFLLMLGCVYPILMARYAHTGKVRHLLGFRWAWNAFTIAPWEYLWRTSIWSGFLTLVTILTPLTAGGAYIIGMLTLPLFMINGVYLAGDYYRLYLDD